MRDPAGVTEWQDAVDAAHGSLVFDSAQKYGLVAGGPTVNVERCEEILRRGAEQGFFPAGDAVERFAASLAAEVGTDG